MAGHSYVLMVKRDTGTFSKKILIAICEGCFCFSAARICLSPGKQGPENGIFVPSSPV